MSPVDDIVAIGPNDSAPDQSMSVWNTRTGERIETLEGHSGAPNHMAFTADGTRLAVAGTDGMTRVWDPSTGDLQLTLGGHIALVSSVSFSPDATQLATASADGRVRIWALDVDTLLEIARQRVTRTLTDDECRRYLGQTPLRHELIGAPSSSVRSFPKAARICPRWLAGEPAHALQGLNVD